MIKVQARDGEPFDALLRRFNNAVTADGILKELKERSHYEKPSVKKRRIQKQRREERLNPTK
jgi:small subunit ribosomal protein S21